jgi:hypothetical protein
VFTLATLLSKRFNCRLKSNDHAEQSEEKGELKWILKERLLHREKRRRRIQQRWCVSWCLGIQSYPRRAESNCPASPAQFLGGLSEPRHHLPSRLVESADSQTPSQVASNDREHGLRRVIAIIWCGCGLHASSTLMLLLRLALWSVASNLTLWGAYLLRTHEFCKHSGGSPVQYIIQ